MRNDSLRHSFAIAATRCLLVASFVLAAEALPVAAQSAPPAAAASDTTARHDSTTIVAWGDSIGNGLGRSAQQSPGHDGFTHVHNLGKDGAGLLIPNHVKPLDHLPHGAVVLMSIGTNDIGSLMGGGPRTFARYAEQVMAAAEYVRAQGATPVIIGMQAPIGPYKGNPELWNRKGFLESWDETMHGVNAAIETAAKKHHVIYSKVEGRVTQRAADNLHYTDDGYAAIVRNALRQTPAAPQPK